MLCPHCNSDIPNGIQRCFRCGKLLNVAYPPAGQFNEASYVPQQKPQEGFQLSQQESSGDSSKKMQGKKPGAKIATIAVMAILLLGGAVGGHFMGLYVLPFLPANTPNTPMPISSSSPAVEATGKTRSTPNINNPTEPNEDGFTPYNLQWTDGSKGLISFNLQSTDLGSDISYDLKLYYNGMNIVDSGFISRQGSLQAEISVAEFMSEPGEYYFTLSVWDDIMQSPTSETITSAIYTLGSERFKTSSSSVGVSTAQKLAQSSKLQTAASSIASSNPAAQTTSFSGTLNNLSNFHEYTLTLDKDSNLGFSIGCTSNYGLNSIEWNVSLVNEGGNGFSVWDSNLNAPEYRKKEAVWKKPPEYLPAGRYDVLVHTAEYMFEDEWADLEISYSLEFQID